MLIGAERTSLTRHLTRITCCTLAIAASLAAGPARALADGDPASDVLLEENVFYPYAHPAAARLERELDGAASSAARAGVPIKVALIGSPVDLGAITTLWGQPQRYADYLDREISFGQRQPLLVVMPSGYGRASLSARADAAVAALRSPAGATGDDLASAAIDAIERIAAADGHPISLADAPVTSGSSATTAILVAALSLAAVAIAAALAVVTLRRRPPTPASAPTPRRRPPPARPREEAGPTVSVPGRRCRCS